MDKLTNPFTPNAGAAPPVLVGRDDFLRDYEVLLTRLANGYSDQSLLVTGLRGVGKTVLLNEFERIARKVDWVPSWAEVSPRFEFSPRIYQLARQALFDLSPRARWSDRFKRTAAVLKSFSLTFSAEGEISGGFDVEAAEGVADTGFLDQDLSQLFIALGEAAAERRSGVVFLFDELQFLDASEMEGLVVALHRTVQKNLPISLVGAGLPQLPELAGEARSYAERLFRFPQVGKLNEDEVRVALTRPGADVQLRFSGGALDRIYKYTDGYPYFVQEFGRALWNSSSDGHILSTDVDSVEQLVSHELDLSFFRVRTDRVSTDHLTVLRGMAELGRGPIELDALRSIVSGDIDAEQVLADLTQRAMVYAPRFGYYGFTVPHYDAYLRRRFPWVGGRVVWSE